ncbi:MAG: hypothetical protein U0894_01480 [Pirellulales bacterium]
MLGQSNNNRRHKRWVRRAVGASVLLAAGGLIGAFTMGGGKPIIAKVPSNELTETQLKAVEHASTLSLAFRASSERVLPAVVSIQNSVGPKKISNNRRGRGSERVPNLDELDPFFRKVL